MGAAYGGANNTRGFEDSLLAGRLPPEDSITYCGAFSENTFNAGPPETQRTCGASVVTGSRPIGDSWEAYLGIFLKSKLDGKPRGTKPIDVAILLDTSGSMSSAVGGDPNARESTMPRLALCKEALFALLEHLRPDDGFGLAEFKTSANILYPVTRVADLDFEECMDRIGQLTARGGTTVPAGMDCGIQMLDALEPDSGRERRILFLTDMCTMGEDVLKQRMEDAAAKSFYTSIIGIGIDFNSTLTEMITKVAAANYFCITKGSDVKKVLVDDFHYHFFPCSFDVRLQIESGGFDVVEVFGTPFDTYEEEKTNYGGRSTNEFYPHELRELLAIVAEVTDFSSMTASVIADFVFQPMVTVTDVNSIFPSNAEDDGRTEGGLILVRLRPNGGAAGASVRVHLASTVAEDGSSEVFSERLYIGEKDGIEAGGSLDKGVTLAKYVQESRRVLKNNANDYLGPQIQRMEEFLGFLQGENTRFHGEDALDSVVDKFGNLLENVRKKHEESLSSR